MVGVRDGKQKDLEEWHSVIGNKRRRDELAKDSSDTTTQ